MKLIELIVAARRILDDQKEPFLFTDEELAFYAHLVQEQIIEQTFMIDDSTTATDTSVTPNIPLCTIPVTSGTAVYTLHPRILAVKRVVCAVNSSPIYQTSAEVLDAICPSWATETGTPTNYILNMDAWSIRLYPIPNANTNLLLNVKRYPLTDLSASSLSVTPELPVIYHDKMLNGILHLAYMKQDVETYNEQTASLFLAKFQNDLEQIKRMEIRRKPRTIYGLRSFW